MQNFETSRLKATRIIATLAVVFGPVTAGAGWFVGTNVLVAMLGAALFAALGAATWALEGRAARLVAAQALTGQCIVLNAAFMGHTLQIDMHMVYFVVLASLVMMSDLHALLLAAGTIAVHHLSLTFLMPAMVYPSSDLGLNLLRTTVHGVVVVLETAALSFAIHTRLKLNAVQEGQAAAAREAEARTEALRIRHAEEARLAVELLETKLKALAEGDMRVRITEALPDAYAAIANSFNTASDRISAALQKVMQETDGIKQQSQEIAQSASELSKRSENEAATVSRISESLDDLTGHVRSVAHDVDRFQDHTEAAREKANQGGEVMTKAVSAMDEIETSSTEVRKIISVIDNIAFQTNLLALNAGVEAARAGDAGRGFAVVATEVRALASRSSEAAREIDALINASGAQIAEGVQLVKRTGTVLEEIKASVEKIAAGMSAIAQSSNEQSRGLGQVNDSIAELDQVAQANAAMLEETLSANTVLSENAEHLSYLVAQFRLQTSSLQAAHAPSVSPVPDTRSDEDQLRRSA